MPVDEKFKTSKEDIKIFNIFSSLPIDKRDEIWKEFFEKAPKNMNIIEFLKIKFNNRNL